MKRIGSSTNTIALVAALVVAAVVAGFLAQSARARKTEALFAGTYEQLDVAETTYYARSVYDFREYLRYATPGTEVASPFEQETESRDLYEVYDAGREQLEAMIQARQYVDAVGGASIVDRLRIPTVYRDRRPAPFLQISYPQDGAVFPPNLCEPSVEWEDPVNELWQVTMGISGTDWQWRFVTTERQWRVPAKVWRAVRKLATERDAWIQIKGVREGVGGPIQASPKVRFRISQWPADNFVVYRLISPPFNKFKTADTLVRDVRSFEEWTLLGAREGYCFNCHTFSSKHASEGYASFQARYLGTKKSDLRVYIGIYDIENQRGWKVHLPFDIQMTTFLAWAPREPRLAFSANQQLFTVDPIVYETQFAGEPTSDIGIYSVPQNTAYLLPGASDPEVLEIYPRWSPDGASIVFCSTPAGGYPSSVQYDLHVVPFNDGKGGVSSAIPGASNNGKSNYYPRFSPDEKWLSFCQSDGGSLIKSSSDLYLLPADLQGSARRLECNADYAADSWHSWSSNGRWLVFASKRDEGIYARLYLTQIDDEGRASPAIRLPLERVPLASYNLPEFVADRPTMGDRQLFDAIRVDAQVLEAREKVQ